MVALVGGGWGVISGVHKRVTNVDTRLDRIELSYGEVIMSLRSEFVCKPDQARRAHGQD